MTRWAPFLWLTGVVVVLLLALARLSSGVLRGDHGSQDSPGGERPHSVEPVGPGEPTGPRRPTSPDRAAHPTRSARPRPESSGPRDAEAPDEPAAEPPVDPAVPDPGQPGSVHLGRPGGDGPAHVALSTAVLFANVALTQGLIGVVLGAGLWWFEIPGSAIGITADPWIAGLPALGLGLAFGLALWGGNELTAGIADAVGAAYDEAVRGMLAPSTPGGWAVLLGLVLPTVAVVEELLFRAALIGVPAAALGVSPWLLAVLSSVAFALGHGAQGRVGIAVTGVLGFVLASGYVLTGSLLVVIVAHYVVNALEFVVHEGLGVGRLVQAES